MKVIFAFKEDLFINRRKFRACNGLHRLKKANPQAQSILKQGRELAIVVMHLTQVKTKYNY